MLLSLDNLVLYLDTIYSYLMKPTIQLLFRLYYRRSIRGKLEHANQDILFYSASFLAKQIRDKQIKSEFVVKSYIARIKQIQPVLNCVVDERFEQAIQEARELDARIERGELEPSEKSHPLLGVPFTCKELIEVRGLNWSCGLVARKHVKADEDAPVVTQMRAAGAIPVCVTITSELGLWFESSNHVYGQCRNPYDTTRMVGGSSGGEGCLIAAQGSVIGIGSDIAGSLRIPAVFNGIFSHKPTNGLIKNVGVYPYVKNYEDFMLTMGPMCRYSEDLEPVLDVLLDDEAKSKLVNFDSFDLKKTKFYYISHLDAPFVSKMSPEVRLAHVNFIKYIEEKFGGAKVERIDPGKYFGRAFEIWFKMITDGKSDQVSTLISTVEVKDENNNNVIKKKNPILELLKSVVGMSEHTLPTLALGLLEKLPMGSDGQTPEEFEAEVSVLRDEFARLLGQESVLIFPSFPSAAPYHNQALLTNPLDWAVYFGYVNSIGLPSTQLPLGLAKSDDSLLPVGVQLISNRFCDRLTIRLAQLFEKDLGGWIEP